MALSTILYTSAKLAAGKSKQKCSREQWSSKASHVSSQAISERQRNEANIEHDRSAMCCVCRVPSAQALCKQRMRAVWIDWEAVLAFVCGETTTRRVMLSGRRDVICRERDTFPYMQLVVRTINKVHDDQFKQYN